MTPPHDRTILRTWSARATPSNADRYVEFFDHTLARQLQAMPGFRGARVSTRQEPEPGGAPDAPGPAVGGRGAVGVPATGCAAAF